MAPRDKLEQTRREIEGLGVAPYLKQEIAQANAIVRRADAAAPDFEKARQEYVARRRCSEGDSLAPSGNGSRSRNCRGLRLWSGASSLSGYRRAASTWAATMAGWTRSRSTR